MLLEKQLKIECEEDLIKFSEDFLQNKGYNLNNVKSEEQINDFYEIILPKVIIDYFSNSIEKEKFDVLLVKSGIELNECWMNAIGAMIKKRGKILIKKMA